MSPTPRGTAAGVRIVITGATGNIGSSNVEAASGTQEIEEIVGVARRRPTWDPDRTTWVEADIQGADLTRLFEGADAVIHLAWAIQPSRDLALLERTNVLGSRRVFDAARAAGVPRLVYSSSVGAYSAGPSDTPVSEDWPIGAVGSSVYSRQKAAVERELDQFEAAGDNPEVVRIRPGLVFKRGAASEIRRLFAGPFLPGKLLKPGRIPVLPVPRGLRFQAVHSLDLAEAFLAAARSTRRGAFNVAADPPLGPEELGAVLEARPVSLPGSLVRTLADLTWRMRLQPSEPGWIDLALGSPVMSTERAREELGWNPKRTSIEALTDLLEGMADAAGHSAPHLKSGKLAARLDETRTGVGARQWARSPGSQVAKYLADAHSIEKQALIQMEWAPRMAGHERLAEIFREHRDETRDHEASIGERLEELGHRPSPTKDALGRGGGIPMLLFAAVQPDTPGKLLAHAYSYEHMEAAAYGILAEYAGRTGDKETSELAARILDEERAMAARIEDRFDLAADESMTRTRRTGAGLLGCYLADSHALECQAIGFYSAAARSLDDDLLVRQFTRNLRFACRRRDQLDGRLEARDRTSSTIKSLPLAAGGHLAAGAMGVQPDPVTKLAGFAYAFQHVRIAGCELLKRVAIRLNDQEIAAVAGAASEDLRNEAREAEGSWSRLGGV